MNADITADELDFDLTPPDGLQELARQSGRLALWSLTATAATLFGVGISVVMGIGSLVVAAVAVVCVLALGVVVAAALLLLAAACVVGAALALAVTALALTGGLGLVLASWTRRGVVSLLASAERVGRLRARARSLPRTATS